MKSHMKWSQHHCNAHFVTDW